METKENANFRKVYHECCCNCQFLKGTREGYLKCQVVSVRFRVQMAMGNQDAFQEGERTGVHVCNFFELLPQLKDDKGVT